MARGAGRRARQRRRGAPSDGHGGSQRGLQRLHGRGVPRRPGAGAAAVPPQHRLRRAAHSPAQRGDRRHPRAGPPQCCRTTTDVAAPGCAGPSEPRVGRHREDRRAPSVAHDRGHLRGAPRAGVPRSRADPRLAAAVRHHLRLRRLAGDHPGRRLRCPGRGAAARRGPRRRRTRPSELGCPIEGVAAVSAPADAAWRDAGTQLLQVYLADDPASAEGKAALERVRGRGRQARGRRQRGRGRGLRDGGVRRRGVGGAGDRRGHVPAPGARVAVAVAAGQGARAQRRVDRRGVRRDGPDLAGGHRVGAAVRPTGDRGHHDVGADRRVRVPVRAVDGLRGVHPGADARGVRRARRHRPCRGGRNLPHRAAGHLGGA